MTERPSGTVTFLISDIGTLSLQAAVDEALQL